MATKKATASKAKTRKKTSDDSSGGKTAVIIVLSVLLVTVIAIAAVWIGLISTATKQVTTAQTQPIDIPDDDTTTTTDLSYKETTVINDDGDYKFETDASFIVDKVDDRTTVYTTDRKVVPYFSIDETDNYTRSTVSAFLDGIINSAKSRYQNRLTGEPEKITADVNDEKVQGIKFAYSTTDGSKVIYAHQYIMQFKWDDDFYVWTCNDYKDEGETHLEMLKAMASFTEIDD